MYLLDAMCFENFIYCGEALKGSKFNRDKIGNTFLLMFLITVLQNRASFSTFFFYFSTVKPPETSLTSFDLR